MHPYSLKTKSIITLTTDFGSSDEYVGVMKGVILSLNPHAFPVDITHEIEPGNILHAQFIIKNSWSFFPEGTIHMCIVDPGVGGSRKGIIVRFKRHLFIGPDNGIFSFALNNHDGLWEIREDLSFLSPIISSTFHGRDVFAPLAGYLSKGIPPEDVGGEFKGSPVILNFPEARKKGNSIEGEILFFDRFGNAVTNIMNGEGGSFIKIEGLNLKIPVLEFYSQLSAGEILALRGSRGYIEISVNMGNAKETLSLRKGQKVILFLGEDL